MSSEFSSIYLTGWEFNRLLSDDPIQPRLSCLPAATLWQGSALFWMFEKVYCTSESLDGETYSARDLKWPSGEIFLDLENLGILQRISWERDLPSATHYFMRKRHEDLRSILDEPTLRELIRSGADKALEEIKLFLLEPAMEHLGCFLTGAPSSIPSWFDNDEYVNPAGVMGGPERQRLMRASRALKLGGLSLVPHPADAVSKAQLEAQSKVDREIESPLIPDLLLGTGPNTGLDGHAAHVEALKPYAHVYQPVNDAMSLGWQATRNDLRQIRSLARTHLWPKLHGEMLPRLQFRGMAYADEFEQDLRRAVLQSPIASYLDADSSVVFSFVASASALAVAAATIADYHELKVAAAAAAATSGGYVLHRLLDGSKAEIGGIRTFAQRIQRR